MTTLAALDKLVLHAPEGAFRLHDIHSGLWAKQTFTQGLSCDDKPLSPWAVDGKGREVYGTIQGQVEMGHTIVHLSANSYGFKVTTNPNKWTHPWEVTATAAQLPEIRSTLHEIIGRFASVNVDAMATQHVDVCRQAIMDDNARKYADIMLACPPPRKVAFPEPGGIRYGTGKQAVQTAFYDVGKRVAEDRTSKIRSGVPGNLARLEPRMNNGKSVSKHLGVGTLAQLAQLTDADLTGSYIELVNAEVFRFMPATAEAAGGQLFIPYSQGVYELKTYCAAYGDRLGVGFAHYVKALGVDGLLLRWGSFMRIRQHLESEGMDRTRAWRIVKRLEEDYKMMPAAKNKATSMVHYLHELHERFTVAA
jgi:hypothetical protein